MLPLLLVVIALLGLSILSAVEVLDGSRLRLERSAQQLRAELAGASAEARVGYLLLTEPMGQRGVRVGGDRLDASGMLVSPTLSGLRSAGGREVRELIFDRRPYRLAPDGGRHIVDVAIQDEAGLLNLNGGDEAAIERLLGEMGLRSRDAAYLAATLSDFVDGDDIRRLQGAEARSYRSAGRPEPRNAPLRSPQVALGALGWSEGLTSGQVRRFLDLSAASPPMQRLNLNTAPPLVLGAVLGLDGRGVADVVSERENRALMSLADVTEVAGVPLAGGITGISGLPARHLQIRVRVRDQRTGAAYEYQVGLLLDPRDGDAPLIFRPATALRRVPAEDPKWQDWTPFPDVPVRNAGQGFRLRR